MNTLLIRADANTEIGTGHVMRCLALAQAWQDAGGAVTFAMATDAPAVRARLESEGAHVVSISESLGSQADASRTIALAHELGARWVVVDGYHFDSGYQRAVKDAGLALLWIDDEAHAEHYCADIVLNQNLHAAEAMYAARESYTRLLLGPRYVLLRREFLKWRAWQREIPPIARKILVTLGGGDPDNVTLKVIQALKQIELEELQVVVLIGATNPHSTELEATVRNVPFSIRLESNVSDMPKLMAWADVAVSGAGSTCWELAFMGLPSIVVTLAENQIAIARGMRAHGAAVQVETSTLECLSEKLKGLVFDAAHRCRMTRKQRLLIEGPGAARTVQALIGSIRNANFIFWK
ncbi:UDP-2,4-diacetamido-2,4,6-trideoxy-beta-L-altropyranose hydrolase [Anaerolineae bacterium CFX7]|nr:UDP-2,4-diacetamido-2,4,6-trideoxy-beta-L-altropyranose hydrolase [Anaerolineae bacterium CFX7]